jgi:hypothetical protein
MRCVAISLEKIGTAANLFRKVKNVYKKTTNRIKTNNGSQHGLRQDQE